MAAASGLLPIVAAAAEESPPQVFDPEPRVIDRPANYVLTTHAADLDGDGDLDVLVGTGERDDTISWHENLGDGRFSNAHVITSEVDHPHDFDTADLDLDGDLDVISSSRGDHKIAWYENLGGRFATQRVLTTTAYTSDSVRTGDLDGDGRTDIVWAANQYRSPVAWHRNLGNGEFADLVPITRAVAAASAIRAGDIDGDGDMDVVWVSNAAAGTAWQDNLGGAVFGEYQRMGSARGEAILLSDLDSDGDLDVASNLARDDEGETHSVWYENSGNGEFTLRKLADDGPHRRFSFCAADLDGDGDRDVCSVSYDDDLTAWYENLGDGTFAHRVVSSAARGGQTVEARDLDGDGDADLLVAAYYSGLVWFENLTDPAPVITGTQIGFGRVEVAWEFDPPKVSGAGSILRYVVVARSPHGAPTRQCTARPHVRRCVVSGLLPGADYDITVQAESAAGRSPPSETVAVTMPRSGGLLTYSAARVLSTDARGAASVDAADFDLDGDLDIVAGSSQDDVIGWYRNDGDGSFSERKEIATTTANLEELHAADLDADGLPDVLSASFDDDKIAWYKNDGDGFGAERVVSTQAAGARFVHAADVDGDGDLDVLSASWVDDKIAWYENDGTGSFSDQRVITTEADVGRAVHTADLDLDGDLDVISASAHDDKIAWYENDGAGGFSSQRIVDSNVVYAVSVTTADFDGDGDPDIVAAAEKGDRVLWYRNEGNGVFGAARIVAGSVDGPIYLVAADVDGDRDSDVVVVSIEDHRVAWYENLGGGVFGVEHLVSTSQRAPWSVHAADFDGDGDLDIATASKGDNTIAWYENLGFRATAPLLSPGGVRAVADLESIAVTWDNIPAGGDGGSAVVRYVVTATPDLGPGTVTCTATAADGGCSLTGLAPGMGYSVVVRAENTVAAGPASNPLAVRAVCGIARKGTPAGGTATAIHLSSLPASATGEPRRAATSTIRWSSSTTQPYSITVDDKTAFACPSTGSAEADETVETTLVAVCTEAGQRDVGVTLWVGSSTVSSTWAVQCSDGNATLLATEHYQGPMVRQWQSATDSWTVHTPSLAGRRAALVARVGHDSPAVPGVSVGILDEAGTELAAGLTGLLEARTKPPKQSASRLWETEYVFDLPGSLYADKNSTRLQVDPTDAIAETDESDNTFDLAIAAEQLSRFKIEFVPIKSAVGEPATIEPATYMTLIHDFLPIADDYVAEVGDTFEFEGDWDQYDALVALLDLWNAEADGDEYWHGVYKYPLDGSSCGYAFLDSHVSVAAAVHGGCTRNINVHEVGHNLNLRHPRDGCGAGNANADYPYDRSGIGPRRGWFFSAARFVNPDDGFADTMSYCGPDFFISDYHYRKAFEHLRSSSGSDAEAAVVAGVHPRNAPQAVHIAAANADVDTGRPDLPVETRSLALTGTVDVWGAWSVRNTTSSRKAPRKPNLDATRYELILIDSLGNETHKEPVVLHPGSHQDGRAAWAVRVPIPDEGVGFFVVRDADGYELLRHDFAGTPPTHPRSPQ